MWARRFLSCSRPRLLSLGVSGLTNALQEFRKLDDLRLLLHRLSLGHMEVFNRLVALVLSVLAAAACSRDGIRNGGIDPPCLPHDVHMCTPEEAATLTASEIPLLGPYISLNCGVTVAADKAAARGTCQERTKRTLRRLSRSSRSVALSAPIEVTETRTCLDTFTPGREAADCDFFALVARVSLSPHH